MTLDPRRRELWHAMGLGAVWEAPVARARGAVDSAAPSTPPLAPVAAAQAEQAGAPAARPIAAPAALSGDARRAAIARMEWDDLQQAVAACTACGLCRSRRQTVFGVGHAQAHWLLVGEAPGAEEDARGEPFVGQAGKLLDNMLAAVGLARSGGDPAESVYIANVLKCRPPGNRNPEPPEVAQCEPFLQRQIALLQPRLVVVMGRFAAQSLLGTDASIASLRGRVHAIDVDGRSVPVIVTYHPAYLLRNLADKAKSWSDLCLARQVAQRSA
ncbi:MAG: uracil-DNA glycosylase [Burkholderiaceae bacterium]|nr:uracil-DNA glycosylase [Burkholderiaceae bacterium]